MYQAPAYRVFCPNSCPHSAHAAHVSFHSPLRALPTRHSGCSPSTGRPQGLCRGSSSAECSSPRSSGWFQRGSATSFDGPSQPAIAPAVILSLFSFTAHFPYGKAEAKLRHKTLWVLHQRVYEPGISFILTTTPQDPARPLLFSVARGPGPSDPMMFLHDGSSFGHPPLHAVPSAQGLPTPNWLTPIPVLVC